jgi:hypothetical protein
LGQRGDIKDFMKQELQIPFTDKLGCHPPVSLKGNINSSTHSSLKAGVSLRPELRPRAQS